MNDRDTPRLAELVYKMRDKLAIAYATIEAFVDGKLAPTTERLEGTAQALRHLEGLIGDLRALKLYEAPPEEKSKPQ